MITYYVFAVLLTVLCWAILFFSDKISTGFKKVYILFVLWGLIVASIFPAIVGFIHPVMAVLIVLLMSVFGGNAILGKASEESEESEESAKEQDSVSDDYDEGRESFSREEVDSPSFKTEEVILPNINFKTWQQKASESIIIDEVSEDTKISGKDGAEDTPEEKTEPEEVKPDDPSEVKSEEIKKDTVEGITEQTTGIDNAEGGEDEEILLREDWIEAEELEEEASLPEENMDVEESKDELKDDKAAEEEPAEKMEEEKEEEEEEEEKETVDAPAETLSEEKEKDEETTLEPVAEEEPGEEVLESVAVEESGEEVVESVAKEEPDEEIVDAAAEKLSEEDAAGAAIDMEEEKEEYPGPDLGTGAEDADDETSEDELSVEKLIDLAEESKEAKDLNKALDYSIAAFGKTENIIIKTILCGNLFFYYKELGKYKEAISFIEAFLENDSMSLNESTVEHFRQLTVYLDSLIKLLDKTGQADLPFSRVPKIIKIMAEKALKK